jgi:GAF domain-containing protein
MLNGFAMAGVDPRPLPPSLRGRYRVLRVLSVGTRSTVLLAHDDVLERDVAIKLLTTPVGDRADTAAQQAEALRGASLNHYAVTTLFDAGVDLDAPDGPQVYLVMEYIPGTDLRDRLRAGPLTPEQVCWLGLDLAEGLDYVHEAGLVHHDIKPANVLLADRRAATRIRGKLSDFGISTLVGVPDLSEFTTGTAAYLSPEQVEGEDATPQSDVYALGLVLLEALTARTEYPGDVRRSAFARLERQPRIPETVPEGLARLLERMTARAPEDRPALKDVALVFQSLALTGGAAPAPDRGDGEEAAVRRRYSVRDSPADDAFDTVTRLAVQLLDVPAAAVAMLEAGQVSVRSARGLDGADLASCLRTYPGTGRPWSVPDLLEDERTPDLPPGAEGAPRAFAAAPLISRDGVLLGALCVLDRRPRSFRPGDLDNLADLAGVIMRELELRLSSRRALFDRD